MGEAHGPGRFQNIQEPGMDGRLAAGKLHRRRENGLDVPDHLEHFHHLLIARLVHVPLHVGVGKADGAAQIAAIGQIQVGQGGMADVQVAEAAILRANFRPRHLGVQDSIPVLVGPALGLFIELRVGIHQILHEPVVRAGLLHDHFSVFLQNLCRDQSATFGAEAFHLLWEARWERFGSAGNRARPPQVLSLTPFPEYCG